MITYEYPLNERIRTLLRLEDLFERSRHFIALTDPHDHHMALLTLFEILEVASRADLKADVAPLADFEQNRGDEAADCRAIPSHSGVGKKEIEK